MWLSGIVFAACGRERSVPRAAAHLKVCKAPGKTRSQHQPSLRDTPSLHWITWLARCFRHSHPQSTWTRNETLWSSTNSYWFHRCSTKSYLFHRSSTNSYWFHRKRFQTGRRSVMTHFIAGEHSSYMSSKLISVFQSIYSAGILFTVRCIAGYKSSCNLNMLWISKVNLNGHLVGTSRKLNTENTLILLMCHDNLLVLFKQKLRVMQNIVIVKRRTPCNVIKECKLNK